MRGFALVAQLVEQFPFKELVPSSSLGKGTSFPPLVEILMEGSAMSRAKPFRIFIYKLCKKLDNVHKTIYRIISRLMLRKLICNLNEDEV